MGSLIQQRLAFERKRLFGWVSVGLGVVGILGSIYFFSTDGRSLYPLSTAVVAVFWGANGVLQLRRAARTKKMFEARHGADAGVRV